MNQQCFCGVGGVISIVKQAGTALNDTMLFLRLSPRPKEHIRVLSVHAQILNIVEAK
jgi:hypothetical protein